MLGHIDDSLMFYKRQSFNLGLNLALKLVNVTVDLHGKCGSCTISGDSNSTTPATTNCLSNRKLIEALTTLLILIDLVRKTLWLIVDPRSRFISGGLFSSQ